MVELPKKAQALQKINKLSPGNKIEHHIYTIKKSYRVGYIINTAVGFMFLVNVIKRRV